MNDHNNRFEYYDYHSSIAEELHALKDRIRTLVRYPNEDSETARSHWLTDGEWKESALRTMIRQHLPDHVLVGRGFILFKKDSSTQIDLLILKPGKPIVFRDGELAVVTPDVAGAVIEVKSRLDSRSEVVDAATKLCEIGRKCKDAVGSVPWLGLFVYDSKITNDRALLDAACEAYRKTRVPINCISLNRDLFLRFWPLGEREHGDDINERHETKWRTYNLEKLAPAYFLGNVVDTICGVDTKDSNYAWFTYHEGKRTRRLNERKLEECEPPTAESEEAGE